MEEGKLLFRKMLVAVATLALISMIGAGSATAAEKLYVCRPCSRDFVVVAERVIAEMKLDMEVTVKTSGCLGLCGNPAVIEYQGEVYTGMDEVKLRSLLEASYKSGQ